MLSIGALILYALMMLILTRGFCGLVRLQVTLDKYKAYKWAVERGVITLRQYLKIQIR
jgi:hypothetical protein